MKPTEIHGSDISFWKQLNRGDGYITEHKTNHLIVYFKWVNDTAHKLYLKSAAKEKKTLKSGMCSQSSGNSDLAPAFPDPVLVHSANLEEYCVFS